MRRTMGTRYGESRHDQAQKTRFIRAHQSPLQVFRIDYDNESGLKRKGIIIDSPITKEPNPFPASNEFAPPPN